MQRRVKHECTKQSDGAESGHLGRAGRHDGFLGVDRLARAGLWHKLGSIVAMLVALLLDVALSAIINYGGLGFELPFTYKTAFLPLVAIWYIVTELGSITENAARLGAPVPKFLTDCLAKLKDKTDEDK